VQTFRGTVVYKNGREPEHFTAGPAAIAEWEFYAMRHGFPVGEGMPPVLGTLVIAHSALAIEEGFEVWRPLVLGVDMEAEELPPTRLEASGGS